MANENDIPDGVPGEEEFDPQQPNPHAVPVNHENAMSIHISLDVTNGLIILALEAKNSGDRMVAAIPVANALLLTQNLLGKCNELLMAPRPDDEPEQGGPRIVLPGEF